jgi:hypothetical protein
LKTLRGIFFWAYSGLFHEHVSATIGIQDENFQDLKNMELELTVYSPLVGSHNESSRTFGSRINASAL